MIKKLFSISFSLFLSSSLFAQNTGNYEITVESNALQSMTTANSSDAVDPLLPTVSPKSPSAAGIEKLENYSVTYSNGLPSIEIPIYNISAGDISVPIKLTYHAAGVKVTDVATPIGLGWNLVAGGAINRSQIGRKDEESSGWFNSAFFNPNTSSLSCELINTYLEGYTNNIYDSGADLFSVSSPVVNGKFSFPNNTNGTGGVWNTDQKSVIQWLGGYSYKITSENGVISNFTEAEGEHTFNLTSIESQTQRAKVMFNYFNSGQGETSFSIIDQETINDSGNPSIGDAPNDIIKLPVGVSSTVVEKRLSNIIFPGGKVTFQYHSTKTCYELTTVKALEYINIYALNVNTNNYQLIKRFRLDHSDFIRTDGSRELKLDKVEILDINDKIIGSYSVNYNTANSLPSRFSRSKDLWDYFNNKNNTSLIPQQTVLLTNRGVTSKVIGGNIDSRNVNEEYAKTWIIKSLSSPTGGKTEFIFESNRYWDPIAAQEVLVGGQRIKEIRSFINSDDINFNSKKVITYGANENGYGIKNFSENVSNYLTSFTTHGTRFNNANDPTSGCVAFNYRSRTYSSRFSSPISPSDGSPVFYQNATERTIGFLGETLGRKEFKFTIGSDILIKTPFGAQNYTKHFGYKRGQLLEEHSFGLSNAEVISSKTTSSFLKDSEIPLMGILVHTKNVIGQSPSCGPTKCKIDGNYGWNFIHDVQVYSFPSGLKKPSEIETTEYFDNGTKVVKKEILSYNNDYQLKSKTTFRSDGKKTIQELVYVNDPILNLPLTSSNAEVNGLISLRNKNIISNPIESITYIQENSGTKKVLDAQLNTFVVQGVYPKMKKLYKLEFDRNTELLESNLQKYSFVGSLMVKDSRYFEYVNFQTYDTNGNLLKYNSKDGISKSYVFTSKIKDNVSFYYPTSEKVNEGLTTEMVTTYYYDLPLIGPKQVNQPNNLSSYYDYDSAYRLLSIKDNNSNVIKSFSYGLKTAN